MLHHFVEKAFSLNQLVGVALLYYLSAVHHNQLVIISHSAQSMSDCDHCRASKLSFESFLNEIVGFHIDIGGGFVEDQKFITAKEGSRQAKELLLPYRKGFTISLYVTFQFLRELNR